MDEAQSDLIVWYKLETEFFQDHVRHKRYVGKAKNRDEKVNEDWGNCGVLGKGGIGVVHKQIKKTTGHYREVKTIDKGQSHKLDYSRELLVIAILAKVSKRNRISQADTRCIPGGVTSGADAGSQRGGGSTARKAIFDTSVRVRSPSPSDPASAKTLGVETRLWKSELMPGSFRATDSKGPNLLRRNQTISNALQFRFVICSRMGSWFKELRIRDMDNTQSDLIMWYQLETEFFQDHVRHTRYLGEARKRNKKVKEDWSNCGELGKGGFGVVHKQVQKATGRYRAVKTIDKRPPLRLDYSRELLVMAILAKVGALIPEAFRLGLPLLGDLFVVV